ncbi:MAG: hypothetical protein NT006_12405 [Candidatus Aminicenantes bacterium]|nr:hypothetical protein [Candidatus Aminicenantes bacterium]
MGKLKDPKTITRRDVLKLAGTAAAFCTSFGFLHGSQTGGVVQDKHIQQDKHLQARWQQAEIKWYKGSELLYSAPFPAKVLKHLQSDETAAVEIKLFRAGQMFKNLGTLEAKH